ncbi:MAG: 1-deoxy-D-xylulose-5-phosphate reductoisomerase [Burkholderiales bacterium]|jgi:1-deoxy-D-xylulose-5-phosphate reductoisomerase|nr:1-deoxy-D-xylulose-5-phosphate reductoisomerase [Burkholderiales bacterium]
MQRVAVLGATGSIGHSTLDVIGRHPDRFSVAALTAHRHAAVLLDLAERHRPRYIAIADESGAAELARATRDRGLRCEVLAGPAALAQVAASSEVDTVMAAIVGAAGLEPSLAAAAAGKKILLANKEALVMAGPLFMDAVAAGGASLLPIDSEHNAIFQCLPPHRPGKLDAHGVRRVLLTGSGGPFRTRPRAELAGVTPDEACAHPTWNMGRKISVDSATMMNKALEIIEAHWLFGVPAERIEVVVHPQSVVHSMVEYADGSVLAQLGHPDMRTPIAQALAYPDRIEAGVGALDLTAFGTLSFERPDFARFPALALAYRVLEAGGTAPAVFNAANEVAVEAFLAGSLPFLDITRVIESVLARIPARPAHSLEDVLDADRRARSAASAEASSLRARAA